MAWLGRESPEDIRLPLPWNAATPRARAEPRGPLSMRNIHHKRSELRGGALELASSARRWHERDHSAFRRSPALNQGPPTTNPSLLRAARGRPALPRCAGPCRGPVFGPLSRCSAHRVQSARNSRAVRTSSVSPTLTTSAHGACPSAPPAGAGRGRTGTIRPRPRSVVVDSLNALAPPAHKTFFFSNLGVCTVRPASPLPTLRRPPRPQSAP